MTAREYAEWQLYDAIEGLADRRADWRAAMVASVIANGNRKKGARAFQPKDFLPRDPAPAPSKDGAAHRVASWVSQLERLAKER